MIKTNYNGKDIYLLDVAPDWHGPFVLRASMPANVETGLTIREARRKFAATLRLAAEYGITAQDSDARRVEAGLKALKSERVVIPFWPAVVNWSDRAGRKIGGGLNLAFKADFSQWQIYEGVEPGWPQPNDLVAPLLWGRLDRRQADWLNSEVLECKVQFTESSPANYAISMVAPAWTVGPLPAAWAAAGLAAPYIFPFEANLATPVNENFSIEVLREQVGFGREPAETFYPQDAARELTGEHDTLDSSEAAMLLKFFLDHATTKAFWTPSWSSSAILTANVGAIDTVLHVESVYNVSIGDYVAFIQSGQLICGRKVTAVGAGTITVDTAPGVLSAATTLICGLVLSRFRNSTLEMQWISGAVAECKTEFREVVEEYSPAADETLAVTQGALPARCYLYDFVRVLGGVTFTDRFTSYEQDLTFGGNTYSGVKAEHSEITQGLHLEADMVQIKTDTFANNPLLLMAQLQMEAPLKVIVRSADVAGNVASNAVVLFTGEIVSAKVNGSRITGTAVSGGTLFDRKVPRPMFCTMCQHALFDGGCNGDGTMTKASWKFSAKVSVPGPGGYPFQFGLSNLAGVGARAITALAGGAVVANYFALGHIEFGTGLTLNQRSILLSTAPVAGALNINLERDPNPFPLVNDDVFLYPGCDLLPATCDKKFANFLNLFAHPFIPIANPTLAQAGRPGGGKK